jgi:PAS domain S-box-containing protein
MGASGSLLRNTLDSLDARIAILDDKGVIVTVNRAWSDFASKAGMEWPNAGIGSNYRAAYEHLLQGGNESIAAVHRGIEGVAAGKLPEFSAEYQLDIPDDAPRDHLMRVTQFEDDDGRYLVVSHTDITKIREAERALRRSERQYRRLIETSPDTVLQIDRHGTIEYISKLESDRTAEDIVGTGLRDWVAEPDHFRVLQAISTALDTGRLIELELWAGSRDEPPGLYQCRMQRNDRDGQKLTVFVSDITEQRRTERALAESERQLRHAQRMESIGVLAGGVAHDFGNLLSVIFSYADTMREDLPEEGPAREDLDEIVGAAQRATELTRQLLAFSRKQVLKPKTTNPNKVVSNMEKMLRRLVREDIELEIELDPSPAQIRVDVGQLEQVLMNLVVNARDAMPNGGTITVSTARKLITATMEAAASVEPGVYAVLTVKDGGEGMDEATRRRIFEPFYTTKGSGKGTGLGLSTVLGIVQQSGGYIEVESTPGEGSTFFISLPTVEDSESGEFVAQAPEVDGQVDSAKTILIVEDDPEVRGALRRLLSGAGYAVITAIDGNDGVTVGAHHQGGIDLVLSDLVMPGLDGPSVIERLTSQDPDLRAILMTGYAGDQAALAKLAETSVPVLEKPFSAKELLTAVSEALGSKPD